jgi:hypothetical protein
MKVTHQALVHAKASFPCSELNPRQVKTVFKCQSDVNYVTWLPNRHLKIRTHTTKIFKINKTDNIPSGWLNTRTAPQEVCTLRQKTVLTDALQQSLVHTHPVAQPLEEKQEIKWKQLRFISCGGHQIQKMSQTRTRFYISREYWVSCWQINSPTAVKGGFTALIISIKQISFNT